MVDDLVRLYDLPPQDRHDSQPRVAITVASTGDLAATIPPSARTELRLSQDGQPVATVLLHPRGACSIGKIATLNGPLDDVIMDHLQSCVLQHLRWSGYAYCLVPEISPQCSFQDALCRVPQGDKSIDADIPSMPYGDIFVDLSSYVPLDFGDVIHKNESTFTIRRPEASEQLILTEWIRDEFGQGWASEIAKTFHTTPISSVIAVEERDREPGSRLPVGFIGLDSVCMGMLSTIAVHDDVAKSSAHIGGSLLTAALCEAKRRGYGYVILSGVSRRKPSLRFCAGSWTIPGSYPGIFGRGITRTRGGSNPCLDSA